MSMDETDVDPQNQMVTPKQYVPSCWIFRRWTSGLSKSSGVCTIESHWPEVLNRTALDLATTAMAIKYLFVVCISPAPSLWSAISPSISEASCTKHL
ncbi:hypothetical protein JB92DRAFT_2860713 [Gautieria morchelliformis]|nr:hypothetical protein JB92DRAFT_2860713 [Gautieria morchelliformis]